MDCRMNVEIAWQEGDGEQVALHARKVATPAAIKRAAWGPEPGAHSFWNAGHDLDTMSAGQSAVSLQAAWSLSGLQALLPGNLVFAEDCTNGHCMLKPRQGSKGKACSVQENGLPERCSREAHGSCLLSE